MGVRQGPEDKSNSYILYELLTNSLKHKMFRKYITTTMSVQEISQSIYDKYSYITGSDDWVMCFFAVEHSEEQYIKDQIISHLTPNGHYLLAKEITYESHEDVGGEHFHIMMQTDKEGYHKMSKNIQLKYKLRGRAKNGLPRQYGKVKKVDKVIEAISYTGKDGIWDSNLPPDLLKELHNKSYQKNQKGKTQSGTVNQRKTTKTWAERVVDELRESAHPDHKWNHYRDKEAIINKILACLGKTAKKMSKKIVYELYWGIYNALPKEFGDHQRIVESLVDTIGDHI